MFDILFFALTPAFALFFEGIRRKLVARMENRIGPPIWQPFYDIIKLWKKKKSDSSAYGNIFFRISPFLYFLSALALFLFIPFSIISFSYDFILLIYITILCSGFYVLSGFSSDSPFGIVGSMREMITMVVYEICLAVVIFTFMIYSGALSFAGYNVNFAFLSLPISAFCLFLICSIEIKITPSDTAEAPTEIMDGYKTEFSGRGLVFLELVGYMKLTFFAFLAAFLLFGKIGALYTFLASLFFIFLFSFSQATTPRYRVDQVFKLYIIILILALLDLTRILVFA